MPFDASGYATAAWLFLRAVGATAVVAFASLAAQYRGLFGTDGVLPIPQRIRQLQRAGRGWQKAPTLFWLRADERAQLAVLVAGTVAGLLVVADVLVVPALMVVFVCYGSFVNVGSPFLSYQWDVLLLETTAVAVALALSAPPPPVALLAVWWLSARLVFTSGVVKLQSGDPTWRDGTAMTHHYETQPLPTRWAWWAHQLPDGLQRATTRAVLAVELAAPVALVLMPWPWRLAPIAVLALLQVAIAMTGNYGFFNLLALVLLVPLIPDGALLEVVGGLGDLAPRAAAPAGAVELWVGNALGALMLALGLLWAATLATPSRLVRRVLVTIAPWRLASQYGLFANMTTSRPQIVIEATADGESWQPYRFVFQADDPHEPPRWNAPHQPRLDWQLWFAALGSAGEAGWLSRLLERLAGASPPVLALLAEDPLDGRRPQAVRAVLYDYRFTGFASRRQTGRWWQRERLGLYHRPVHRCGRR